MLNRSGITKTSYGNLNQILANVELQASVGCLVPQSMGVDVDGKKIVKAGTPLNIDLTNTSVAVKAPAAAQVDIEGSEIVPMNAVLLHDVDVTNGGANGTALYFGIVNLNRLEADVQTSITAAAKIVGKSQLIVLVRA